MMRSTFMGAGVALLASSAFAQNIDNTRVYPITVPVRDAGVLDLATGQWTRSGQALAKQGHTIVYNNDCNWTGGSFYYGPEHCEEVYDTGRIPSSSDPNAPAGATDDNLIDTYQIGYCTAFSTGTVDIKIGFIEQAAGCTNPVGKFPGGVATLAEFDLAGTGLPGDNAGGGNLACWTVTLNVANGGFCMLSDGDGVWDNAAATDNFNWIFAHRMDNATFGIASGPFITGDPIVSTFGGCSYTVACGVDPFTALPCGTGLGIADSYWVNADDWGAAAYPPATCPSAASAGSTCYWFGGWPANPWGSYHMQMTSSGACSGTPGATVYCTAAQNPSSSGCLASISGSGSQPVSGANDYTVTANTTEINKPTIVFFGTNGQATIPFSSGQLCIAPPLSRTAPQNTGNVGGAACTGSSSLVINNPAGVDQPQGTVASFQVWLRDPAGAGTDVSDAIEVTYQ